MPVFTFQTFGFFTSPYPIPSHVWEYPKYLVIPKTCGLGTCWAMPRNNPILRHSLRDFRDAGCFNSVSIWFNKAIKKLALKHVIVRAEGHGAELDFIGHFQSASPNRDWLKTQPFLNPIKIMVFSIFPSISDLNDKNLPGQTFRYIKRCKPNMCAIIIFGLLPFQNSRKANNSKSMCWCDSIFFLLQYRLILCGVMKKCQKQHSLVYREIWNKKRTRNLEKRKLGRKTDKLLSKWKQLLFWRLPRPRGAHMSNKQTHLDTNIFVRKCKNEVKNG